MPIKNRRFQRQSKDCRFSYTKKRALFRLHPLFLIAGVWYACTGKLFLFLLSALVAIQHECAHAFASARLGYKLNKIILMPFGAIIDGDLDGISFQDEIYVALWGPLCNLITAGFFVALWWLAPTMYAFTDSACYSSLAIALVNLLPAYPLDGGRILKCALARAFLKRNPNAQKAEKRAGQICQSLTLIFAGILFTCFLLLCFRKTVNITLLAFSLFLGVGAFGNRDKQAVYNRLDFSTTDIFRRGAEIRRVAVLDTCTVKSALRFLSQGSYLVLEIYDRQENHLFNIPQNLFSSLFASAENPYETLGDLYRKKHKNIPLIEKINCKV